MSLQLLRQLKLEDVTAAELFFVDLIFSVKKRYPFAWIKKTNAAQKILEYL